MMKRTMPIVAALLLLTATPALADWGASRWGMTPEQVVKAVPGAQLETRAEDGDLAGMHRLAFAPASEGAIKLKARFYFAPNTHKLGMVDLLPEDVEQCQAFRDAVVARLGETDVERNTIKSGDHELVSVALHWTDKASGDALIWAGILFSDSETDYGICKMIQRSAE